MASVDERIDQVLRGLNAAEAPARLEQRVTARIAQRVMERAPQRGTDASDSLSAGWQFWLVKLSPYAVGAAVALLMCSAYVRVSHRVPQPAEQVQWQTQTRQDVFARKTFESAQKLRVTRSVTVRAAAASLAAAPDGVADDPDAIALAETMAPSHPAPPMPATPQELVTMRGGHNSHSIEIAELTAPHEPGFRTQHERTEIRQYILGLLDPLVTAQNLTSSPPATDDTQTTPPPDPNPSTN